MTYRGALFTAAPKDDEYRPKHCRTRNCSLPFEHEGDHDGAPTRKAGPVVLAKRETLPVRGGDRAAHRRTVAESRKFTKHSTANTPAARRYAPPVPISTVRHVNANPRGYVARQHMAEIRAGMSPDPLPTVKAVSRRQQILARRLSA